MGLGRQRVSLLPSTCSGNRIFAAHSTWVLPKLSSQGLNCETGIARPEHPWSWQLGVAPSGVDAATGKPGEPGWGHCPRHGRLASGARRTPEIASIEGSTSGLHTAFRQSAGEKRGIARATRDALPNSAQPSTWAAKAQVRRRCIVPAAFGADSVGARDSTPIAPPGAVLVMRLRGFGVAKPC